ncbi:MAG: RluA family pseudouridine synthase [Lachnospiraceae bacterium]|nr:RluA family pseudouridine synthase [Lachnospiraceae bacterium]
MERFEITEKERKARLDMFLLEMYPEHTRSYLQKEIKAGNVLLNGLKTRPGVSLKPGDTVDAEFSEPEEPEVLPEDIPLSIVYEDQDVILVDKPKGMVVHPAPGHTSGTLVNALLYHCTDLSGINGVLRPGIVHRIDKDTTGIVIACKNDKAHISLSEQLAAHTVTRRYYALVHGNFRDDEGTVDAPIGRNRTDRKKMAVDPSGKEAVTHYRVLERFGQYTFIECRLETGRTHQIRVHMSSIGHPLLGDLQYGSGKSPFHTEGQCLHAYVLGFIHPSAGEYMEFTSGLPDYFKKILDTLRKDC